MFNWLYNCLEKKFNQERINRWICAGAIEGLKNYYQRYGRYPEYVVDIGAHYGSLSKAALEKGAKKVWSIEASKDNYKVLCKNLKKYSKLGKAECSNLALDEYNYETRYLISNKRGNSGQKSLTYKVNNHDNNFKKEKCYTISAYYVFEKTNKIIDYLKVDIEGNEFYALSFTDKTRKLLSKVRFLDIELHSLDNSKFFDKKAFLNTHPEYNPNKDMIIQFIEFLGTCGFYLPDKNIEGCGAVKIFTANKNLERVAK